MKSMLMKQPLRNRLVAEAFGTFWLVFAGTGAIVVHDLYGVLSHLGVAAVFGLVVFVMISAVGDISGAHFNPAVTLGFLVAGRLPRSDVAPYILAQVGGAMATSLLLRVLFPAHAGMGATLPAGSVVQAWVLEVVITLGLMFVILSVSTGARERGITAGLAIGGFVALAAAFAGPVTGASMNPARSIGPALASGQWADLWIYLSAPVVGAALAVTVCACCREDACCSPPGGASRA